jgi:peroxiredoxin
MRSFKYLLLLLPVWLQAQTSRDFVISGFLKGLPDQTEVILRNQDPEQPPLATARSKAGKFTLQGKLADADIHYLSYTGSEQKGYMFLEASRITVTGHKDSLQALSVKGSAAHDDFTEFNSEFMELFGKASQLSQKLGSGPSDAAAVQKEYEAVVNEINLKTDAYVDRHKSSVVSPFVMLVMSQLSEDPAILENRYAKLNPPARESLYGRMVGKTIEDGKIGAIGSQALDFSQNDPDGKSVSLSSFRGKYVLVDFWASWCKPCRMENPNVVEAFRKFNEKNFTVLGVSLDRAREPWLQAIKDDKLEWTHVSDLKFWSNAVAQQYRISSIPQNLLIDPKGVIIAKNLRGAELQQRLASLLK